MQHLQETLIALAKTVAGFAVVLGVWILVQMYIRRHSGCVSRDKDLLDYMPHGCANCSRSKSGQCSRTRGNAVTNHQEEEQHHHELA
jgi:hypothetical protein